MDIIVIHYLQSAVTHAQSVNISTATCSVGDIHMAIAVCRHLSQSNLPSMRCRDWTTRWGLTQGFQEKCLFDEDLWGRAPCTAGRRSNMPHWRKTWPPEPRRSATTAGVGLEWECTQFSVEFQTNVRSEVLTEVKICIVIISVMTPCSLLWVAKFWEKYMSFCHHHLRAHYFDLTQFDIHLLDLLDSL